jgi:hypothetical protein
MRRVEDQLNYIGATLLKLVGLIAGSGTVIACFVSWGVISNQVAANSTDIIELKSLRNDVSWIRARLETWEKIGQPTVNDIDRKLSTLEYKMGLIDGKKAVIK